MKKNIRREIIKSRLKEELEASKMSFTEIAKAVGVKVQMITQYRNSTKLPSIETLSKICEVLGADANYILGITEN